MQHALLEDQLKHLYLLYLLVPFDRVGVDVIQYPKSSKGNQYAVVFVDYLTKWPEVLPVKNQTAPVIAKLLVEHIICRHSVPNQLLSDRGTNFLSNPMSEVYFLMGIQKLNTTAYHPQTDGLVERFNCTLTNMLAKTVQSNGKDWDQHLPYVLFAYRSSPQSSTGESPFFLLYGRDPKLPTEAALTLDPARFVTNTDDYKVDLIQRLSGAWDTARQHVKEAQRRQKRSYDQHTRDATIQPADRVFIYMPRAKQNRHHKFARPFHGPYCVVEKDSNTVLARPVNQPNSQPIRVSLSRVRPCPSQLADIYWPSHSSKGADDLDCGQVQEDETVMNAEESYDKMEQLRETGVPEDDATKNPADNQPEPPKPWSNRSRMRRGGRFINERNQRGH